MSKGTSRAVQRKRHRRALAALGAAALAAGLAAGTPAAAEPKQPDGVPVACDGKVYVSFGNPDQLYTAEREPGRVRFETLGAPTPFLYNAIGVNPDDRFLYALTFGGATNELVRFDGNGDFTTLGAIAGLPKAVYISGTFDDEGNYYVLADDTGQIYRIDVEHRRVTGVVNVPELADPELDVFDIAFRDGFLWGSTDSGAITRVDIAQQSVDFFPGVLPGGEDFGGVFVYGNGDLGFFRNSGELIRVRVKNPTGSNPRFTVLSRQTTTPATNLDATSCFFDSSADLAVRKHGPEKVRAGERVTYTVEVKNDHKGDSSGWSLTDDLPAKLLDPSTSTEGCGITDGLLSCTGGPLAEGGRVKITVTGTAAKVTKPTRVPNTATVFGDDEDPRKENDKGFASTVIKPPHEDGDGAAR
ncbi:hypothetical protein GCM10010302_62030 [Streptomyces polychromogenes]|uniref:DUF11 domain-containing protein n=1 Tax=Streptomyces polychromogenes TaxID=67342 RepID=A0ABN0VQS8_9ACTN